MKIAFQVTTTAALSLILSTHAASAPFMFISHLVDSLNFANMCFQLFCIIFKSFSCFNSFFSSDSKLVNFLDYLGHLSMIILATCQ